MGKKKNVTESPVEICDVANYFLHEESMSPKKLQKLIYFSYAWFIYLNSEDSDHINTLFNEKPQAWIHGPVFKSIYDKYKDYKWHKIPQNKNIPAINDSEILLMLKKIWEKYGKYEADELEAATHCEDPWRIAREDAPIYGVSNKELSDKDIFLYYEKIAR